MNVLVTDGENRSALAVTRSLGRKGCRVVVTGTRVRNLASSSRFCWKGISVPDPLRAGVDYVKAINEIVGKETIDVIFPMTEQSIHLINKARDVFSVRTVLACPSAAKFQAVSDKIALCRLAETLEVPVPQTLYLSGSGDLPAMIGKIAQYPVVVKPALSIVPEANGFLSVGVKYAASREELEHLYATSNALRYPSMIQEKIVGAGTGLFTLYDTDRHLALFSHRRVREKPPSGGVSVVSESIQLDEDMVEGAGRLLAAVGWTGVAMVEFKRDHRDGKAKLMEINGRFWGSLQLAIACGVDFPALLLDFVQGKKPPMLVRDYRVGHKLKWFFGTLDHVLIRLKTSDEKENHQLFGYLSKLEAVTEFLRIWDSDTSFDVFDREDKKPFVFEAKSYLRQALGMEG